jgi:hypothetical protein
VRFQSVFFFSDGRSVRLLDPCTTAYLDIKSVSITWLCGKCNGWFLPYVEANLHLTPKKTISSHNL